MHVGILGGTGPAGSGLGIRLAAAGLEGPIGWRPKDGAQETVGALRAKYRDGPFLYAAGATRRAASSDVVVIATPWDAAAATAKSVANQLAGKVVISMANALARVDNEFQPLIPPRGSVAASVGAVLPQSLVGAAFHHLPAKELA